MFCNSIPLLLELRAFSLERVLHQARHRTPAGVVVAVEVSICICPSSSSPQRLLQLEEEPSSADHLDIAIACSKDCQTVDKFSDQLRIIELNCCGHIFMQEHVLRSEHVLRKRQLPVSAQSEEKMGDEVALLLEQICSKLALGEVRVNLRIDREDMVHADWASNVRRAADVGIVQLDSKLLQEVAPHQRVGHILILRPRP
mmetsp:Transcript_18656/g.42697  ORF Transcript_18656/g.42697 Transcript_18656/m.42697 type:complete len:200 (-) Transcript_18656:1642-2241(-)